MISSSTNTLDLKIKIFIVRGIYGIICGSLLVFINHHITKILIKIIGEYYLYLLWLPLILLYLFSIPITIFLGAKTKYDKYLRGFTIYFSLAILIHIIISSL